MRIAIAAILALAGCSLGPTQVTGPVESTSRFDGLEQEIRIEPALQIDASGRVFNLTSRIVNRGEQPVTVRVATCYLEPGVNIRSRARLIIRAIPGCIQGPNVLTLAPGEASNTIWFTGEIQPAGRHTIEVRHALDPEFWGRIQVVAR